MDRLTFQQEWSGLQLVNTGFLVCPRCYDLPNEQLRAYAVPPDPLPVRNPRLDMSAMGGSLQVTITAGTPVQYQLDGFGNPILDGFGNPIVLTGSTFMTVLAPDATRTEVGFLLPRVNGLWISLQDPAVPGSGLPYPNYPGSQWYAPGSAFSMDGLPAQYGVNCYTTVAGLTLTVITS